MFSWVRKPPQSALDTPLFTWAPEDPVTVRGLLNGGIAIFGRAGSGKTSSSGRVIGQSLVNYPNSGGLILAAKPEDADMWREIFARAGRPEDLLIFSPESNLRFNFIDYEMQQGGHTRNITRAIKTIGETLRSSDNKGSGENADFFEKESERLLYNEVEIVKLATGRVTAPDLQNFINTAAMSPKMFESAKWREGFHNRCVGAAFKKQKNCVEMHDYGLAENYWLGEFPAMASRTRSAVMAGVLGILHVFNTGIVRDLVSGETNVSPDDMLSGKWILVDMAPAEYGDLGSFVNAGWKYLTQRMVLRRDAKEGECINVIWCDEFQQFVNSMDAHYLAQCRSHLGCMVVLTQSKHSLYSMLKGQAGKHQADALLTNFHHKVFHALGDAEVDAAWASGLVGKSRQTFVNSSSEPDEDVFGALFGPGKHRAGFSENYSEIIQPNVLMNGLRTGGPANGFECDCIVIRSGEPFSNGANWLKTYFSQR